MTAAPTGGGEGLAGALEYVEAGYAVAPVTIRVDERGKKRPIFHTFWETDPAGVTRDPEQVKAWAAKHPGCGWHAPTGPNGLVVVDMDLKRDASGAVTGDGRRSWAGAGGPTSSMAVTTQSGGRQAYFRAPADEPIRNSAKAVKGVPDVDVRGEGGTVFISGTYVQGGGVYVANRVVPAASLPTLGETWERRLRDAGPNTSTRRAASPTPRAEGGSRLVSASKVKTLDWVEAKVDDELRELVRGGEANFHQRLFGAAAIVYRAVGCGVLDQDEAEERIASAIRAVWAAEPDADDAKWLAEAREKAMSDPWRVRSEEPVAAAVTLTPDSGDEATDEGGEPLTAEELEERAIQREVDELRRRRDAQRRLVAEDAPPLRWLDFDEFLDSPEPEPIVPGVFYRDSLSRIVGAPGCGKSFLSLDLALSVALGRDWSGEPVEQGPVVYVMAEGQRVNTQRAKAWLDRHHIDRDELAGRFYTVPDAVLLVEEGVTELVRRCEELRPALVILDTKNAMMVGEENSGTDANHMRRALDAIRKVCDACVVLIDHTGKAGGDDGRGSNAVKAMMDTQLKVENDGGRPAHVTVTVVRDKAAEAGRTWNFFLRMHHPAAVLLPTDLEAEERVDRAAPDWKTAEGVIVPTDLLHFEGAGAKVMPALARFLAHDASPRHGDPEGVGVSRTEATRAMRAEGFEETSVRRAWSALISGGWIDRAEGVKNDTGRHVWTP